MTSAFGKFDAKQDKFRITYTFLSNKKISSALKQGEFLMIIPSKIGVGYITQPRPIGGRLKMDKLPLSLRKKSQRSCL
jgi:hypothetical protein